jgi:endoglucanase
LPSRRGRGRGCGSTRPATCSTVRRRRPCPGPGRSRSGPRADQLLAVQAGTPYGQPYDPDDGWDWGSTGRILGALLILAAAHTLTGESRYRDGALTGLDYVFGRNPVGLSFVTGWGTETAPLVLVAAWLLVQAA